MQVVGTEFDKFTPKPESERNVKFDINLFTNGREIPSGIDRMKPEMETLLMEDCWRLLKEKFQV